MSLFLALWPQPMLQLPHEMQPVRRGPTPPKYGSSASTPGVPKYTPTGALLNVSPLPISTADPLQRPVHVGRHVRIADDSEHPPFA